MKKGIVILDKGIDKKNILLAGCCTANLAKIREA